MFGVDRAYRFLFFLDYEEEAEPRSASVLDKSSLAVGFEEVLSVAYCFFSSVVHVVSVRSEDRLELDGGDKFTIVDSNKIPPLLRSEEPGKLDALNQLDRGFGKASADAHPRHDGSDRIEAIA